MRHPNIVNARAQLREARDGWNKAIRCAVAAERQLDKFSATESSGQKPRDRAAQGTPADEQSGETSPDDSGGPVVAPEAMTASQAVQHCLDVLDHMRTFGTWDKETLNRASEIIGMLKRDLDAAAIAREA